MFQTPQVLAGRPHIRFGSETDARSQTWLYFHCTVCMDKSQKLCANPKERANHWLGTYVQQHPAAPHR